MWPNPQFSADLVTFTEEIAVLRAATLLKERLWQRWFPLNFAKFLRTPFSQNTSERLLLKEQHPSLQIYLPIKKLNMTNNNQWNWKTWKTTEDWGLRPATLLKKRLWHRCFSVNVAKFLITPFLSNTSGGCFRRALHGRKNNYNSE